MDFLSVLDVGSLPGITVELVAAAAVIVVVKLFLGYMKEARAEQTKIYDEIRSVIDRNTTALSLNSKTMNRVIEIVTNCKLKSGKH